MVAALPFMLIFQGLLRIATWKPLLTAAVLVTWGAGFYVQTRLEAPAARELAATAGAKPAAKGQHPVKARPQAHAAAVEIF
jgi:hypothetical protein